MELVSLQLQNFKYICSIYMVCNGIQFQSSQFLGLKHCLQDQVKILTSRPITQFNNSVKYTFGRSNATLLHKPQSTHMNEQSTQNLLQNIAHCNWRLMYYIVTNNHLITNCCNLSTSTLNNTLAPTTLIILGIYMDNSILIQKISIKHPFLNSHWLHPVLVWFRYWTQVAKTCSVT